MISEHLHRSYPGVLDLLANKARFRWRLEDLERNLASLKSTTAGDYEPRARRAIDARMRLLKHEVTKNYWRIVYEIKWSIEASRQRIYLPSVRCRAPELELDRENGIRVWRLSPPWVEHEILLDAGVGCPWIASQLARYGGARYGELAIATDTLLLAIPCIRQELLSQLAIEAGAPTLADSGD